MKKKILIIAMLILCTVTLVINIFFDEYKAWGAASLLLMTLLAMVKKE